MIQLVVAAQHGDQRAFDELFTYYHNKVFQFALREVKNEEIANDIMQETFIEIFRTIGNLKEPVAFTSWMRRIAYHQCTRYYKRKEVKHELVIEEDGEMPSVFETLEESNAAYVPDASLDAEELKNTVREFMNDLPEAQRSALMMMYFDELPVKQIAEIQGVPENTVLSRLRYGRNALKKSVESYEEKNGIRLHAIPFLPMLRWALSEPMETLSAEATASAARNITAATGVTLSASSMTSAVASAASAASTAVGIGAKIAALPLVTKIIVGATAAITAVVAAVAVPALILNVTPPAPEFDSGVVGEGMENLSSSIEEGLAAIPQEVEITDTLSAQERAELNRYLSYFSEADFMEYPATDEELFGFGQFYNRLYERKYAGEADAYFDYGSAVRESDINDILMRFFGKEVDASTLEYNPNFEIYEDGVIYTQLGDGATYPWMSVAREVYKVSDDTYRIVFDVYELHHSMDFHMGVPGHFYSYDTVKANNESGLMWVSKGSAELKKTGDSGFILAAYHEEVRTHGTISNTVPNGARYYDASEDKYLNAGEKFPEWASVGDIYIDAFYEYHYGEYYGPADKTQIAFTDGGNDWREGEYQFGWGVRVRDTTLSEYPDIPSLVCNSPVTNLDYTFAMCKNLKKAPQISGVAESMICTFYACEKMERAEIVIPQSVRYMNSTFMWCEKLEGYIAINATPNDYSSCFWRTGGSIILCGSCGNADALAGEGMGNVTCADDIGVKPVYSVPQY